MKNSIVTKLMAITLLSLSIMLSGCGKQEIAGQIFVVTKGKENIKLALVAVGAIPQEEFEQHLKIKQNHKLKQQQLLLPKYKTAQLALEGIRLEMGLLSYLNRKSWSKADLLRVEEGKLQQVKYEKVITEFEAFNHDEYFFEGLPIPKATDKTDVDGKFTLSLPKGKYVIAASSSRSIGNSSENYHWLVLVDASSPNKMLMLSNDNLLATKCNECVKF